MAGTEGGQPKATERDPTTGQSNGRPPARDPYTGPREQLNELSLLKARLSNEEFTRQLAQLRCELARLHDALSIATEPTPAIWKPALKEAA